MDYGGVLSYFVGREKLNHERLIFIYTQLIGSVVDVLVCFIIRIFTIQMEDMTLYNGLFYTLSTNDDTIVLRHTTISVSYLFLLLYNSQAVQTLIN